MTGFVAIVSMKKLVKYPGKFMQMFHQGLYVPKTEKSMWVPSKIIKILSIHLNRENRVPFMCMHVDSDTTQKIESFLSKKKGF